MAELCTIYFGLLMVWRKNCRLVTLESDSLEAVNLVIGSGEGSTEDQPIIHRCKELLARPWTTTTEVKHIFREANRLSDWLVKWALKPDLCIMMDMSWPHNEPSRILEDDAREAEIVRPGNALISV